MPLATKRISEPSVPDVVSGLGDGSTDAGVRELDGMLDRVRMERTATTQQAAPLRIGGVLPA